MTTLPTPFYHDPVADITLYHGDCREIAPLLGLVDCCITDPPYPDIEKGFAQCSIEFLDTLSCQQFIFWSAVAPFPLSWSAVHIWHKPNGNSSHHYERLFERNGKRTCRVWRIAAILPNYCQFAREAVDHPTQKPVKLLRQIIGLSEGVILDPFCGSGTTLLAAKELGKKSIGIEISQTFCEITVGRLRQSVLPFPPKHIVPAPQQAALFEEKP